MNFQRAFLVIAVLAGTVAGATEISKFEGPSIQGRLVGVEGDWADKTHVTQFVIRDAEIAGEKLGDILIYNPSPNQMSTPSAEIGEALNQGTVDGAPVKYVQIMVAGNAVDLSELVTNIVTPDAPQKIRLGSIKMKAQSTFPPKGSEHSCCLVFGK